MSVSTTMKITEAAPNLAQETTPTSVIEILSSEISSIAREIEDLPETGFGEITQEQMVWMQQIDFCSQRLSEVSKLIRQLSDLEQASDKNLNEVMRTQANLEHVRNLFD